ncbi:MAG TPA: beta-ketoacyl-ACP synthase III [Polyangiales bacterium]|nr:beta-ketoacyl-ACP synthase III [Polyangiales bacterium]
MTRPDRQPAARILGTGHYLPAQVRTNRDLETVIDTSDEWISSRTGIRQRHIAAEDEASSDMATHASRRALEAAGIKAEQLDLIIVGTISPDMPMPSTAMFVQRNIGARRDCPGFDLSAACAGFIYGLSIADNFVRSGQARYVLVVGVELLSRLVDWGDRSTCVLFGDGAGAAVIGPASGDGRGLLSTHIYADGTKVESLYIPGGGSRTPPSEAMLRAKQHLVHMIGKDVFRYAVRGLSSSVTTALEANGLPPAEVDWVIPHQANIRILEAVQKRTGIPMERFFINIDQTANTSSASVPIALDQAARAGKLLPGQSLVFCALGGGIAWGSALVRW